MFYDHKGYYTMLGVQPNATAALIRAAYRVRAMELHPDRNASESATLETQKLNEAYEVLSDQGKRAAYDRECEAAAEPNSAARSAHGHGTTNSNSPSAHEDFAGEDRKSQRRPVTCSSCGATTAQPRFRELVTVVSWVFSSRKSTQRGTFCVRCERRKSAIATGLTAVFGWWGAYGFFWTLDALFKNLTGAWRFVEQDATLLCLQALYFASVGKLDLAHAVAIEARDMTLQQRKLTAEQRRKAKLGYEVKNSMHDVREMMTELIKRTEAAGQTLGLMRRHRMADPSFMVQAGIILAIVTCIGTLAWRGEIEQQKIQVERVRAEQERLVREGIERQQALAIAQRKADELRALEQPLPMSGLMQRFVPRSFFEFPGGLPDLEVTATANVSYVIKLARWDTGSPVLTIFVRAGESTEVSVPFGTYRIRMASGTNWYGDKVRFGPDTQYSQVDTPAEFTLEGNKLMGHVLRLARIVNGNLRPVPISADQF